MNPIEQTLTENHRRQAGKTVLIALAIAFFGSILGAIFGVMLGQMSRLEALVISLCVVVTGGLTVVVFLRPAAATSFVTGMLTIYLTFHLNAGAMIAYEASGELISISPYVTWFFLLVVFHEFTNFGFLKREIGFLVAFGPMPIFAYILFHPAVPIGFGALDASVTFLFSFYAFVLFIGMFTRHRDEQAKRAARASEAERSAALMRISDERFRLLGLATDDLVWDADLITGKVWWNEALQEAFGVDPRKSGNDFNIWQSWVHPHQRDRVVASLQSVMEGQESKWTNEYRVVCANNRTLDVVARGLILRDVAGSPVRFIGSMSDVTELRILEKKLRHSHKMEAVGQLTGGVAHDFNNLLTIITGNSEILSDICDDDPKAKRLVETTLQAAERGATLTNRLLSFARLQALEPQHINPRQLLAGIEGLIRRTIDEDIHIEIVVSPDILPIEVDPGQIENALINLVINARDAMPEGGRLTIEASNVTLEANETQIDEGDGAGHYVMISVTDSGCGMSPDTVERAFEPFFTTKRAGKGSGLGLSMVWGFVRQSQGHAHIYSELGEGTSVRLYFPAAAEHQPSNIAVNSDTVLFRGTESILVVEDDDLVREQVVAQLGILGYSVREAASAAEAIEILKSDWNVDLLFTDVVMPGGTNGKQLADAARLLRPQLKVLFTSGYTEDAIVHQGRLDPGVSLLGKPYRRADLATKIRQVLDGH